VGRSDCQTTSAGADAVSWSQGGMNAKNKLTERHVFLLEAWQTYRQAISRPHADIT